MGLQTNYNFIMNMKNFNYIAKSGVMLLLAALSFVACADKNDWDTDESFDRLFSVTKMSVSTKATEVEYTWSTNNLAEYYIIELSTDSLYDDVAMGEHASSIVYGEDKSIKTSPIILDGLDGETKYFLRVKAFSSVKKESNWSYLDDYSFKTKSEQIITKVVVKSTAVTLQWLEGAAVTHVDISKDGNVVKTVTLTDSEITEGEATITELESSTDYTATIYNGDAKRGEVSFQTTMAIPDGFTLVALEEGDDFVEVVNALSGKVVLLLPQGSDIKLTETLRLPSDITSIIFWGADGEAKPKLQPKGIAVAENGTVELVKFYNLELYNNGPGGDYIINQDKTATIGVMNIESCIVKNTRGVIRIQGSGTSTAIDEIVYTDVIFENIGNYGLVNLTVATCSLNTVTITKSTVDTQDGRTFDFDKMDNIAVVVDQCTFNNACSSEIIRVKENGGTTLTVNQTILGKPYKETEKIKACNKTGGYVIFGSDVYYTSDCIWSAANNSIGTLYDNTSTGLFLDPENGDLTIKDGYFSGKRSCGDPRWYMPE